MNAACASVILIVLVTFFMFVRSNNRDFAVAILPLLLVPAAHLLGGLLSVAFSSRLSAVGWLYVTIAIDLAALLAALPILFVSAARRIRSKSNRRTFLVICILFLCALTLILVLRMGSQISALTSAAHIIG